MTIRWLLFRILNTVCRSDITHVLWRGRSVQAIDPLDTNCECRWLTEADLEQLRHDTDFRITPSFIEDYRRYGFLGVIACVDEQPAGLLFLVADRVAARHNSAGSVFSGIAVELPPGVFFLFKVFVKEAVRGRRINAAMLRFAETQVQHPPMEAIITTTDWTNQSFLKSVESLGFQRCAMASEFVIRGKHFHRLPRPFDPQGGQPLPANSAREAVRFVVDA
ncbi:hypothetical protein ACUNV4_04875 [Granulosicoccus sp. 3-233]|uniref:hypothetical protein n=1 Tax=Granulosicoccus sp. 3-233 TaxID=3417969 RepID=UPI003D34A370